MNSAQKKRTLKLRSPLSGETHEKIFKALSGLDGVTSVTAKSESQIQIEYNLLLTNLKSIEEILDSHESPLSNRLWDRFLRSWLNFTEENEFRNLKAPQSCCGSSG